MRQLASVLCLLVLCFASASAQSWNLARDPSATLTGQITVTYDVPGGLTPDMTAKETTIDEVIVWRTGNGIASQTLVAASTPEIQGHAAVRHGVLSGRIVRPMSNATKTKVWYNVLGVTHAMNFEVRWDAAGATAITRLPDDVFLGAVN